MNWRRIFRRKPRHGHTQEMARSILATLRPIEEELASSHRVLASSGTSEHEATSYPNGRVI